MIGKTRTRVRLIPGKLEEKKESLQASNTRVDILSKIKAINAKTDEQADK